VSDPLFQLYPLRALRRVIWLATLGLVTACAPAIDLSNPSDLDVPSRARVADVPLIQQADFFCGPTSIAMVMQWSGHDVSQNDIAQLAFSPGAGGTYLADMMGAARRQGQLAVQVSDFDALLAEVAAGHPVIVFQNLGVSIAPVWHYGVVTGYDFDRDEVYLNSGERDEMVLPVAIFLRTWARGDNWGLVVLPPDQLPATASEVDVLQAAAALERVKATNAAETLYQTGAARWPGNWLWQFGRANALYGQGDLRGAYRALLLARTIAPDVPEIQANLNTVIAEGGF